MKDYDETTEVIEVFGKLQKQAPRLKRLAFWWQDMRVVFYRYFNLDYSKVVGFPMTRRKYEQWKKTGKICFFKCDSYQVCSVLPGLSPHIPTGDGWMSCERDSGKGFKCGKTTRAYMVDDAVEITSYM